MDVSAAEAKVAIRRRRSVRVDGLLGEIVRRLDIFGAPESERPSRGVHGIARARDSFASIFILLIEHALRSHVSAAEPSADHPG